MRVFRPRTFLVLAALAALGAAAAVGVNAAVRSSSTAGGAAVVKVRATGLGRVLTDSRGFTLYLFLADKSGKSACYGSCASFWPALVTTGKPKIGAGAKAGLLGTTKRRNGQLQVTYAGHPLYRFALDKKAGQTSGEGLNDFGAHWYAVSAAGKKVVKSASSSGGSGSGGGTTTTTGTTTTDPYGNGGGGGG
jgi:predicted lipoprotein with Yx(FWY)xxD motif